ncbi:MAG: immunoglobulin domain-containing protein, partial [Verrucomicrobiae bacterium]|nr:immunoglobulin domain-containing protein [Verrucomicrobiae bacterium]
MVRQARLLGVPNRLILAFWLFAGAAPALGTIPPVDYEFGPVVNGPVYCAAIQPDGKILIGGSFTVVDGQNWTNLARLEPSGALDTDFVADADGAVYCLAILHDGKILVGGDFTRLSGHSRSRIGRLNSDGSLDAGFDPGADGRVCAIVPLADGRILVGGQFTSIGGENRNRLAMLDSAGAVVPGFNPGANDAVNALAVQPDGKILVAGCFTTIAGGSRQRIARLYPDGSLDQHFAASANASMHAMALQPNGQIIVGGTFSALCGQPRNWLGRLNGDGTLDGSFNPDPNGPVHSVALFTDGMMLVAGEFTTMSGEVASRLCWLNPNGTLSPIGLGPGTDGPVYSLAAGLFGRIVVAGNFTQLFYWLDTLARQNIARLAIAEERDPEETIRYRGSTITWLRPGTRPEFWRTTFEYSTNNTHWVWLGAGDRISGGWQLAGVALPAAAVIRARGYVSGGYCNGSGWFVEKRHLSPCCAQPVPGLVAWWRAEGDGRDCAGGHDATELGGVSFTNSMVGRGFWFDGEERRVLVPDAPELDFGSNQDFSIEAWILPLHADTTFGVMSIVDKRREDIPGEDSPGYEFNLEDGRIHVRILRVGYGPAGPDLRDGRFHHVAVTLDRDSPTGGKLFVDGQVVLTFDPTGQAGDLSNSEPLRIGNHCNPSFHSFFNGVIDEVSIYNRALTREEIALIYLAGSAGKCGIDKALVVITNHPTGQVANAGSTVAFTVGALGMPPLSYQWYKYGVAIAGASGTTLVLSNVLGADAGNYHAVVSTAYGSVTSAVAALSVIDPVILRHPTNQTVSVGMRATFTITAIGTEPLRYQWYFNTNTPLPGATNAVLTLENVQPEQAGVYSVVVSNALGAAQSAFAELKVGPLPQCAQALDGLVGWWQAEGDGVDGVFGNHAVVPEGVRYAKAVVGSGFFLDGGLHRIIVPDAPALNFGSNQDFSVECWIVAHPTPSNYNGISTIFSKRSFPTSWSALGYELYLQDGRLAIQLANGSTAENFTSSGPNLCDGLPHHIAAVVRRADPNGGRLYVDGEVVLTFNPTGFAGSLSNNAPVLIGNHPNTNWMCFFKGIIDELSLYNRALAPEEIVALYTASVAGKCFASNPPVITAHPVGRSVIAGERVVFSVAATGLPLRFQWYKDADPIPSASRPTLILTNAFGADAGNYFAVVSNPSGTATSAVATLTVFDPVILTNPSSLTTNAGSVVNIRVVAAGTTPLVYHWYKDGVIIPEAGGPTLTLTNVLKADSGNYWAIVSNQFSTVTSAVASLTVIDPAIIAHPANQYRGLGDTATFSVNAAGTQPLRFQWYKEGQEIPSATNASLVLTNLARADAGFYYVTVSNVYGMLTSRVVGLTVNEATCDTGFNPRILSEPFYYYYARVSCVTIQPDRKILLAGVFDVPAGQTNKNICRLNPDGTCDRGFKGTAHGQSFTTYGSCLGIEPNGKIVVGGKFTTLSGCGRTNIGRLNPDGTIDLGFSPVAAWYNMSHACVAVQPDGKILMGGYFEYYVGQLRRNIARLNSDGSLDIAFNPSANGPVRSIALQPDGKIVLGGEFTTLCGQNRLRLGRLNPDGTLDTGFAPEANGPVYCVLVQPDNKILVGGKFTTLCGYAQTNIGRLNPDGSFDVNYRPTAVYAYSRGNDGLVATIAMQVDGKVLIGGEFNTVNGLTRYGIARLHPDGTLDMCFNPSERDIEMHMVESLAIQPDGKILVGGKFRSIAGQTPSNVGRINNTDPAFESLRFDGATITWLRGGTSPEVWRTTFEASTNGTEFFALGEGSRIPGGWQLTGLALSTNATIRARGHVATHNSSWFVESAAGPPVITRQPLSRMARPG